MYKVKFYILQYLTVSDLHWMIIDYVHVNFRLGGGAQPGYSYNFDGGARGRFPNFDHGAHDFHFRTADEIFK